MFIVGLTGGIGSGKSEAARMFAALGVPVVDTDAIAHGLTSPGSPLLAEIAQALGRDCIKPDGSLDRAWLRRCVFADADARRALENILHPRIRETAAQLLAQHADTPYQIVVVPLLFETGGYAGLVSHSLVVDCDEALQITRTMQRNPLSEAEVRAIMAAQLPRSQRVALADDVIENDGSLKKLEESVRAKHEKYIKTCIVS
ncbi:MAG TPA: dephospho-CoA kinase [Methylophilaceae bacterium]|nr:dephospho-CoA kinase [Methylophilaceae bacterium]HQR59884.1 dephospho-CoA kinase [Methylophilaceae bacterium]